MERLHQLPPKFVATFIRHVKLIQIFGINIFDESETSYLKRHRKLTFFGGMLMVMLISQILFVIKRNEIGAQFLDVVSAIPSIFIVVQDFIKMSVVAYKRDQIEELIVEIGKIWPIEIESEEKEHTLNSWRKRLKLFDDAFFRAAIISLIFFELLPLAFTIYAIITGANVQYQFPVQIYFSCSSQCHYKYALAYTFQFIIGVAVHICIYVSCDFLLVDLTFDLSALLSLVRIDLENVVKPALFSKFNFEEDDCKDIISIVMKHQKLLSLSETLNQIFGEIIFSQVSFSSVVICCYGFMAVIADGMFLRYLTASLGIMFAIFIIAWPGQMLSDTSSDIAVAAYQCRWYERGKKFRKCIAIIMARSQKECHLSALGFSDLTLAMFSKVMSTSWSYLSLLNQMYEDFDM